MSDCTCGDYEVAAGPEQRMVTARKPHKCCECGCAIEPKEQYELIEMLVEGHWERHRTCRTCAEIAKTWQSDCRVPGYLWEWIHEDCDRDFCICPKRG